MLDSGHNLLNCPAPFTEPTGNILESQTRLNTKVSSMLSSCRICLSSIFDPAALTCGHKFCEQCLDQYWRVREKPDCIICPLCRACAFNVDFAKAVKRPPTEDFRRMFTPITINEADKIRAVLLSVKITAVMPVVYYLLKWLKPYFLQILNSLHVKITSKM